MIVLITFMLHGASNANPISMSTMEVTRHSFEPRTAINAAYQYLTQESQVSAFFKWKSNRPTLNLDNFAEIKEIDCQNSLVNITFDTSSNAQKAHDAWKHIDKLAVLLGHEHRCHNIGNVSTLAVENIQDPQGTTLLLETHPLKHDQVFDGFEVDINRKAPRWRTKTKVGNVTTHRIDWNYDRKNQSVIIPNKNVFRFAPGVDAFLGYSEVNCFGCYLTGDINVDVHIKSKFGIFTEYRINIDGDLKGMFDMEAVLAGMVVTPFGKLRLAKIPLFYVGIPGALSFTPLIILDAIIDMRTASTSVMNFGFDYRHKFKFSAESKNMEEKPKTLFNGLPDMTAHKMNFGDDVQNRFVAHLVPIAEIAVTVVSQEMDISLQLDNIVAAKFSAGAGPGCKGRVNVALVRKHDIDFVIVHGKHGYGLNLYSTSDINLLCALCNKCF